MWHKSTVNNHEFTTITRQKKKTFIFVLAYFNPEFKPPFQPQEGAIW